MNCLTQSYSKSGINMTKVYVMVGKNGDYIKNRYHMPSSHRFSNKDVTKTKHYKTRGTAQGVIKRCITEYTKYAGGMPGYYVDALSFFKTLNVIEVEVEHPNYIKQQAHEVTLKWNRRNKGGKKVVQSMGSASCKCCGVYLTGIPHIVFGAAYGNKARICVMCLKSSMDEMQKLYDDTDPRIIDNYEKERFIKEL